jgi:hypothetical protein
MIVTSTLAARSIA